MDRFLARLSGRAWLTVAFALHVAITLWVTLHHEAWADEADAWLLMRGGDLEAIFGLTSYRGTPLLWYLAVWPFARLGLPYVAQQLVNLAFNWAAVWLMLRSRAFPWPVKVLFAFSYYAAFEYAVLARNYALLMLLAFLMAAQWRERREKPLRLGVTIALLANVSTHGLLIAAVAGLLYLLERIESRELGSKRQLGAMAMMIAGGLLSLWQVWPRAGGQIVHYLVSLDTVWFAFTSAFFPGMRQEGAILPSLFVFTLLAIAASRRPLPLLFLLQSVALLILIFTFVWMGGMRHAGLILVVSIAAIWIADAYGPYRIERVAMAALAVSLAYSILLTVSSWTSELRYAYSGSRGMAAYMKERGLDRLEVAATTAVRHSVFVYLPHTRVWYAASEEYGSYARWDREWQRAQRVPLPEVIDRAERHFAGRDWLLLLTQPIPKEYEAEYELLRKTTEQIWVKGEESYWLYRRK